MAQSRDSFGTYLKRKLASAVAESGSGSGGTGAVSRYAESFPAAAVWVVNHNLGRSVAVRIIASGGQEVVADVRHVSENQVRIYFDVPVAGTVSVT